MKPFNREKRFKTRSPAGTLAIAATIAEILPAPRTVILRGPMGAGKTTLVKGWAAAVHAAVQEEVTSPTFTLVHEYKGPSTTIYHLDLYRLDTEREIATIGIREMADTLDALLLVEWGEKSILVRQLADAEVIIEPLENDERSLHILWSD